MKLKANKVSKFLGVEELVPRLLWEQELNAGSSPVTQTNKKGPVVQLIE
jgi:hypothetical protein